MPFPRKAGRPVVIDGIEYRYKVSPWDENNNHTVYVQMETRPIGMMKATVESDVHFSRGRVAGLVRQAIKAGWKPNCKGPIFSLNSFILPRHVFCYAGKTYDLDESKYVNGRKVKYYRK